MCVDLYYKLHIMILERYNMYHHMLQLYHQPYKMSIVGMCYDNFTENG